MSEKTIVCLLILENGYEVVAKATVKDQKDFKIVVGEDIAYQKALRQAVLALGAILD